VGELSKVLAGLAGFSVKSPARQKMGEPRNKTKPKETLSLEKSQVGKSSMRMNGISFAVKRLRILNTQEKMHRCKRLAANRQLKELNLPQQVQGHFGRCGNHG